MVADFFSKPLQGKLFIRFRDMIMGIIPMPPVEDPTLRSDATQERVESENFGADGRQTDAGNLTGKTKVTWADVVRKTSSVPTK